jgi:hypothetical protein
VKPSQASRAVEIVITPTEAQYRELCADLEALRAAGAETNTLAILAACREAAARHAQGERRLKVA